MAKLESGLVVNFFSALLNQIIFKNENHTKNPAFRQDFSLGIIDQLECLFCYFANIFKIFQGVFIAELGGFFKIIHGFGFVAP